MPAEGKKSETGGTQPTSTNSAITPYSLGGCSGCVRGTLLVLHPIIIARKRNNSMCGNKACGCYDETMEFNCKINSFTTLLGCNEFINAATEGKAE
jgi:hypothetical protein